RLRQLRRHAPARHRARRRGRGMRRQLCLLSALAVMAVGVMSGAAAAAPRVESVSATFTGGPDTITSFGCMPVDQPVTCHGTAGGEAAYSGGWIGTSHYDYRFLILPSGTYIIDLVERFSGSVAGCGV